MRIFIGVLICRIISFVCKLFKKNGTVFPGLVVYDYFSKKILEDVKYPKYVIAVTGSSGKGSTTSLIAKVLDRTDLTYVYNDSGSNGVLAATTLILNNCSLTGKFKKDVLLLECDERHLKLIFSEKQMTHLIITNITRDQPSRNGHPNIVFNDILKAIDSNTKLIINADDPLVNTLSYTNDNVITYGIDKFEDSYKDIKINSVDFGYCPLCAKKLKYDYYHYGHIGSYKCMHCEFKRSKPDYVVTNLNLLDKTMMINKNYISLSKDILYAAYFTVCAYSLCMELGISEKLVIDAINNIKDTKRGKELNYQDRNLVMLETKNENALSYYQSLKYINNYKNEKTVILGFDNVSRRYKFNDLSWLYDVEFEYLNDPYIDKVILVGRFRYDVATRLEYTGISSNKIKMVDDINNLKSIIDDSKGKIFTMVCFDMTAVIKEIIEVDNENN